MNADKLRKSSAGPEKKSWKIAIASWAPFHAGAEVAAKRLALGLREHGHRVLVVLGTKGETLERMKAFGIDVRHVPLALTDKRRRYATAAAEPCGHAEGIADRVCAARVTPRRQEQ